MSEQRTETIPVDLVPLTAVAHAIAPQPTEPMRTLATVVNKAEEGKRLRFLLSPLTPILGRKPAELQQPRLVRVKLQIKLRQSLLKFVQESLGIRLVLKPHHQIVRVADTCHLPARHFPSPYFHPQVKDVVQVHVCQQR